MSTVIPNYIQESLIIIVCWCLFIFFVVYGLREVLIGKASLQGGRNNFSSDLKPVLRGWISIATGVLFLFGLMLILASFERQF